MKQKTESVRINKELMDQVREIAEKRGAMLSWTVNKAISEWLLMEQMSQTIKNRNVKKVLG